MMSVSLWKFEKLHLLMTLYRKQKAITECCFTVCKFIEKRHVVLTEASVEDVSWLYMQHVNDI